MVQATKFAIDKAWKFGLRDFGINAAELLKHAGLPDDLFSRKDATLNTDEYFRLWNSLEYLFDDPLLPLKVGQYLSAEAFSPPIFAAFCSPNINIALTRLSKYKQLIGPMTLTVEITQESTSVTFGCLYTNKPIPDSLLILEFVYLTNLFRKATREMITPMSIISNATLLGQNEYPDYFGIKPIIDKDGKVNKITYKAEDACLPFLTENEAMWDFFEPQLRERLADVTSDAHFSEKVRSCLFELIPSGLCTSDEVAKRLAVSKRTLQRYLNNEKTTFRKELNKTREQLARYYLTNSSLTGSEISFLLGFDDPNSFVRAYRSWTGETPGQLRPGS